MDDARIRELTEEVLAQIGTADREEVAGLETRVARLESAVRGLQAPSAAAPVVAVATAVAGAAHAPVAHPALRLLDVAGSSDGRCVLEPDKPCEKSGTCKTLGY